MSPIRKLANCRPMNSTSTLKSKPPIAGMMRRIGASIGSVSWWNTYSIGLRPWLTQLRIARINSTQNNKPPAALIRDNKPRNRKSMLNETDPLEAIRISATNLSTHNRLGCFDDELREWVVEICTSSLQPYTQNDDHDVQVK